MLFDRMTESKMDADFISIPTSVARPLDVSRVLQVGDDPLDSTLGDAYQVGNVPHSCLRLPGDAKENMGVVGEKRPSELRFLGSLRRLPSRFLGRFFLL